MRTADKPGGQNVDRTAPRSVKAKKYVQPKLIEYGSTSKLSASKPGSQSDGANSIHMTQCL